MVVAGLAIQTGDGAGAAQATAVVACGDGEHDARKAATMAVACGRNVEVILGSGSRRQVSTRSSPT